MKLVNDTKDIGVNLFFVRQPYPNGLGEAVRMAKSFIVDEPFVVMLGDDLMGDQASLTTSMKRSALLSWPSRRYLMKMRQLRG
ncbi:hypothetical protein FC82_GL000247 [Secundilactobacillus collinoides DSM 20515 = JCM 1123]|uniref:UTP--glucose-1-phosphate uridylyltransferase n=1 Tax=Secundilactobacillus collinoides DSM 20515 = JCM 1123 TaxID=1423733 RepID=A0A0R2B4J3_SECCO|nr:hypothetical protein FC82_GL000247 [Secundilactobacillus collinoides DSM 20515 = JCM 1123]